MYGALPAAAGWQHLVPKVGADIGLLSSSNLSMCVRTLNTRFGHGDDFIVAGDGDDFDWLSLKLNEKLELVQKTRLGPGYDRDATVLNRCVTYSDSELTREADLGHAQPARSRTCPGSTRPSALLDNEELEPDGQKACHSVSSKTGICGIGPT